MSERAAASVAKDVARTMGLFARAARARQLYAPNNAVLVRMMSDLKKGFDELLQRQPELTLRIRPDSLVYEDEIVLHEPNPDESIPFAYFRDGIRRFDFSRGLDEAQLESFVEATAQGASFTGLGDDVVALLWKHDLEHIRYLVVDTTIVDANAPRAAGAGGAHAEYDIDAQIDGLLSQIYGPSSDDVGPRSIHIDGTELSAKAIADSMDAIDEAAAGFHPMRVLPQPACAEELRTQLAAQHDRRIAARATYVALEGLYSGLSGADGDALTAALLRMYEDALMNNDLLLAAKLVAGIRRAPEQTNRISEWLVEVGSEPRLRQAAASMDAQGPEGGPAFLQLLRAIGPQGVQGVIGILPTVADASLRRAMSDLAIKLGIDDFRPVRELLTNEQAFVAQEALYILGRVDSREARALRQEAEEHPRPQVRLALLEAIGDLAPDEARGVASRLAIDPDVRVRIVAIRALANYPNRESGGLIEGMANAEGFDDEPTPVKRELLRSYALICQVRALPLLSLLIKRGEGMLSKKEAEEVAVLAIDAVVTLRTPRTIEILKKACLARSKRVREAAREALVRMKEAR